MRTRNAALPAVLFAVCLVSPALAQSPSWETFGPPLFQVNAVATGSDELAVYAGGADYAANQAALFKSADGGRRWETLEQAEPGEFFSDILVDPGSPATIYAGALFNGATRLYRSGDGGETWSLRQTIPSYCIPSFAPGAAAGAALVACGTRLLRTSDAGLTWQDVPAPFTESTRLTTGAAGSLFAYGQTRIFKSTNGGVAWAAVGNALPCAGLNALRVDPANASVFVAGAGLLGAQGLTCGGVYRSTNAGNTWTASDLSGVYVTDIAMDARDPARVYACAGYLGGLFPKGGAYESADGGANWSNMFLPALGALRLALSHSGQILYAATSVGVYALAGAGGPRSCAPDDQTLCLNGGRFRVAATWTRPDATSGAGHAVSLTGDTGYFWFFDSSNVEVIVKVLEACGVNAHRWVFASGLTNVQVTLTVTDVVAATTNTYTNPQATAFRPVQDTTAFPCE
jgi:photosystem II stability/assembly factor-like uncharacterized protein